MRRRSTILISSLLLILGVGCEIEPTIFTGPYFVRFTEVAAAYPESRLAPIQIEVHNGGPAVDDDIHITYTVSGSAREGIDYVILGERGKVTIEEDEYFGFIEVKLINNANNILRQQDIVFEMQEVDDDGLKVGQGTSNIGKTFTFTIQDVCILSGDYYGIKNALSVPTENITVTSGDCENYVLSNWDIEVFRFPSVRDLRFVDNGDNTLTIPAQKDDTLDPTKATIDGFGVVDPVTRIITMTVRLVDEDTQPQFTFKLIPN